jgi:hypothetical protein
VASGSIQPSTVLDCEKISFGLGGYHADGGAVVARFRRQVFPG